MLPPGPPGDRGSARPDRLPARGARLVREILAFHAGNQDPDLLEGQPLPGGELQNPPLVIRTQGTDERQGAEIQAIEVDRFLVSSIEQVDPDRVSQFPLDRLPRWRSVEVAPTKFVNSCRELVQGVGLAAMLAISGDVTAVLGIEHEPASDVRVLSRGPRRSECQADLR